MLINKRVEKYYIAEYIILRIPDILHFELSTTGLKAAPQRIPRTSNSDQIERRN